MNLTKENFIFLSQIGEGSQGSIWKAIYDFEVIALKIIAKSKNEEISKIQQEEANFLM